MFKDLFGSKEKNNLGPKSDLFLQLLKEKELHMSIDITDKGHKAFILDQRIINGPNVRLIVMFHQNEGTAYFYVMDYLSIEDDKKGIVLEQINKLNNDYMFTTFYLTDDNTVNQRHSIDIEAHYSPEAIFDQMVSMFQIAQNEFGSFMKIIWS